MNWPWQSTSKLGDAMGIAASCFVAVIVPGVPLFAYFYPFRDHRWAVLIIATYTASVVGVALRSFLREYPELQPANCRSSAVWWVPAIAYPVIYVASAVAWDLPWWSFVIFMITCLPVWIKAADTLPMR